MQAFQSTRETTEDVDNGHLMIPTFLNFFYIFSLWPAAVFVVFCPLSLFVYYVYELSIPF